MKKGKKVLKRVMIFVLVTVLSVAGVVLWVLYGSKTSNPHRYATLGDIPVPSGYERISGDDASYTTFLRLLPLKEKGTQVDLYTGGKADMQSLNYAVVDMPLLSNYEQCAECVCVCVQSIFSVRDSMARFILRM